MSAFKAVIKDFKKAIRTIKGRKYMDETQPMPRYHDGLARLANRLHPVRQTVKVVRMDSLSHDTMLIRMVSARYDKPLAPFRAGQYISVKVNIDGVHTGRAYSLVSSPNNLAYYEIAVRDMGDAGFVSNYLCNRLKIGDILELSEPLGSFYYNSLFHGDQLVFIAGGCGVTPFISLIKDIYERDLPLNVSLIFGCLTRKDILFRKELEAMCSEKENLSLKIVLSEPDADWSDDEGDSGFITKEIIQKTIHNRRFKLDRVMFYIVGPEAMRLFLFDELAKLNIASNRVVWEISPPIADVTQYPEWRMKTVGKGKGKEKEKGKVKEKEKIKREGSEYNDNKPGIAVKFDCKLEWLYNGQKHTKIIKVSSTEPLLNGIERAKLPGVIVKNACRAGECALCRSKLISGDIFVPDHVNIRQSDRALGFIHPCVSYPLSDIDLELYID